MKKVELLLKKAKTGDAEALKKLGICYAKGEGVKKDMVKAVKWFRLAAEQGNVNAKQALKRISANCAR